MKQWYLCNIVSNKVSETVYASIYSRREKMLHIIWKKINLPTYFKNEL